MKTKERIYLIFRNRGTNGKELILCDSSEKEFRVLAGQLVNEQEPTQEKAGAYV